jgi:hypothetical protein
VSYKLNNSQLQNFRCIVSVLRFLYLVRRDWLEENWPDPKKLRLAALRMVFLTLFLQISTNSICFAMLATPYGWPAKSFFDFVPIKVQSIIILVCLFVFLFPVGVSIFIYVLLLKLRRSFEVKNKVGISRNHCHSNEHEHRNNLNDMKYVNPSVSDIQESGKILNAEIGIETPSQMPTTQTKTKNRQNLLETSDNQKLDNFSSHLYQRSIKLRSHSLDMKLNPLKDNAEDFHEESDNIKLSISFPNLLVVADSGKRCLNKNDFEGQQLEMVHLENDQTPKISEVLSSTLENNLSCIADNQLTSVHSLNNREHDCHRPSNSDSNLSVESESHFRAEKVAAIR